MTTINLQPFIDYSACQPALDYLSTQENMQEAWDNCTEYENMFWLMLRSNDVSIDQYLEISEKIKMLFYADAADARAHARADAARAHARALVHARALAHARADARADAADAYDRADARADAYADASRVVCEIIRCLVPIVPELI